MMSFRFLALSLLGVLLFSCQQKQPLETTQSPPQQQGKPVVALVIKTLTNPFFIEMEKGARAAEKELGFQLTVKSAAQETSIDQQIAIIEQLMDEKVSAIVIAPGSSTELIPVLKKASDRGIQLVNIDNQLDPVASAQAGLAKVPFVSVDNVQGGYLSAARLIRDVKSPTKVLILEGIREAANANQRKAGALRAFGENPLVQVAAQETANWKIDEGYEVTKAQFKKIPDLGLIFAANDMMALGALEYLKEAGLNRVKVAAYDALDQAKVAIAQGQLVATVDQQARLQGYIGCKTAVSLLKGEAVPEQVLVDVRLVTAETLAEP